MNVKRIIPGLPPLEEGREFCYVEDNGNDRFEEKLSDKVTSQLKQPIAQSGGVMSENCKFWLPTDDLFHALSYRGDIEGWRQEIELGAKQLGLLTGKIVENNIELSNGRVYALSECKVEFY